MLNSEFIIPSDEGLSTTTAPWPPRLAFDMALGDDEETLLVRYNLTPSNLQYLYMTPSFMLEVHTHRTKVVEEGVTFKHKARLQAEEYLAEIDTLIHDPDASPAVRLDAIKSVVNWAGYVPKDSAKSDAPTTRMVIQWADSTGQIAIETKPSTSND